MALHSVLKLTSLLCYSHHSHVVGTEILPLRQPREVSDLLEVVWVKVAFQRIRDVGVDQEHVGVAICGWFAEFLLTSIVQVFVSHHLHAIWRRRQIILLPVWQIAKGVVLSQATMVT